MDLNIKTRWHVKNEKREREMEGASQTSPSSLSFFSPLFPATITGFCQGEKKSLTELARGL